jgi:uncharacterized protein
MQSIGTIYGRTTTHDFKFKVENPVKKWDYIIANHPELGPVLSQVLEIEAGQDTTAICTIVGYRNDRGLLRKPRTPLTPGTQIFPANDYYISQIIGIKKEGLYLGFLEGKDNLKAFVDPKKIITKHLAVIAKSGGGKSYTMGVMLEELANYGVPCVIIDPHGEYSTIKYPNTNTDDAKYFKLYGVSAKGFSSIVKEFSINTDINRDATQLKLEIPQDPYGIIQAMPFKISAGQTGLIHNTVNTLQESNAKISFQDVIEELNLIESNAKWNIISGLQQLVKTSLFSFSPTPITELVRPNRVSIINFKGSPPELQQIAVKSLLTELFEKRKRDEVPPFFMIIEEAHNFCPERGYGEAKSSAIIRTIAAEGRKFGLGLCVVSQRPARVDKSVLSQCTSQMAMQVTNPGDLKAISSSFEGITSETEKEIRNLPVGKVLLIGATDYPIFVDIRVRRSQHGGRAKTFDLKKGVSDYTPNKAETIPTTTARETKKKETTTKSLVKKSAYIIQPKIGPKEIETIEKSKIENISVVLRPCMLVNCSHGSNTFDILFDLHNLQMFSLTEKLNAIRMPSNITTLSPIQKKVLEIASSRAQTTTSEIFAQTGMGYSEVAGIVNSLARMNLLTVSGNKIQSNTSILTNFKKISFPERPKYMDEPDAEKLPAKVKDSQITNFMTAFGIKINSKKKCYLPFFKVKTNDGEKTLDSLTYSLKI